MKHYTSYTLKRLIEAQLLGLAEMLFLLFRLVWCYRIVFFKSIFSLRGEEKKFLIF